jgi:hypothetical protein
MNTEGPHLEHLLHRLAECPPEFLEVAAGNWSEGVDIVAIVCDTLRNLTPNQPPELETTALAAVRSRSQPQLTLLSIVCWLLADEWFQSRPPLASQCWKLLVSDELAQLAELIKPEKFVGDPDRREELVRTCLAQLGLRPQGETMVQAADRLTTLDSAERQRVLRATATAERRAREIREAMARKQAQESASRYGE